ncbi:hypothetical protein U6A24_13435 [Aquimarina gracilis]|uniref:Nucleic acid binding protein n=1 Tax=Aquimarina gracilis TaxID=874422 RepID=A0ABU5ZX73_9FLAO|nr:hypothetical protein [Aquimarina gracilis]MEB3346474.1 hypothetical protein [Aquimarina gracilis]
MNYKNKIKPLVLILVLITTVSIYFKYSEPAFSDISKVATDIEVNSKELVSSYILNEKTANTAYRGKIVEVDGIVKEVTFLNDRNTIILYGSSKHSNVICDMQLSQAEEVRKLVKGQKIRIKGVCKGFLKDAILLHCILTNTQIDE